MAAPQGYGGPDSRGIIPKSEVGDSPYIWWHNDTETLITAWNRGGYHFHGEPKGKVDYEDSYTCRSGGAHRARGPGLRRLERCHFERVGQGSGPSHLASQRG